MKNLLLTSFALLFSIGIFAQEVNADDRVNITQANKPFIGVYAFGYQGSPNPGYPQFQLNNYGGVPGAVEATADNSILGMFQFSGHNGSAKRTVGVLRVRALDNFAATQSARMDFQLGPQRQLRMSILGDNGNIGIGTDAPATPLHIYREDENADVTIEASSESNLNSPKLFFRSNATINDQLSIIKWGNSATGSTLSDGSLDLAGLSEIRTGAASTGGLLMGTINYAPAMLATNNNIALIATPDQRIGVGNTVPNTKMDVATDPTLDGSIGVIRARTNYVGSSDVRAVEGHSVTNPGFGVGGYFTGGYRGAYIYNDGAEYTGSSYGAYMYANGTAGTRYGSYSLADNDGGNLSYGAYAIGRDATTNYGIYATAFGGTNNYAGYFQGETVINTDSGNLQIRDESADKGIYFDGENNGDNVTVKSIEDDDDLLSISTDVERVGINTLPYFTFDIHHELGVPSNGEVAIEDSGIGNYNGLNIHNNYNGLLDNHWTMYAYSDARLALYRDGQQVGQFNGTTGSYTTTSDRKLKRDIKEMDSQMEKIMELKPSTYIYKRDKENITRYGLIAQEVHEVYPQLAPIMTNKTDGDKEDIRGVTYTEFIPILIAGLQEQYGKVKEGEEEIEELKEANDELRAELDVMKDKMAEMAQMMSDMNDKFNLIEDDMSQCCAGAEERKGDAANTFVELNGADVPSLEQNTPNPFYEQTVINYYVPSYAKKSIMTITDLKGSPLKSVNLEGTGLGTVTINANELPAGTYIYTLFVDGRQVASKQMILVH